MIWPFGDEDRGIRRYLVHRFPYGVVHFTFAIISLPHTGHFSNGIIVSSSLPTVNPHRVGSGR